MLGDDCTDLPAFLGNRLCAAARERHREHLAWCTGCHRKLVAAMVRQSRPGVLHRLHRALIRTLLPQPVRGWIDWR